MPTRTVTRIAIILYSNQKNHPNARKGKQKGHSLHHSKRNRSWIMSIMKNLISMCLIITLAWMRYKRKKHFNSIFFWDENDCKLQSIKLSYFFWNPDLSQKHVISVSIFPCWLLKAHTFATPFLQWICFFAFKFSYTQKLFFQQKNTPQILIPFNLKSIHQFHCYPFASLYYPFLALRHH